jgi:hypothetical protein
MAERELREEVAEEAMAEELEEEGGQKKERKNTSQKDLQEENPLGPAENGEKKLLKCLWVRQGAVGQGQMKLETQRTSRSRQHMPFQTSQQESSVDTSEQSECPASDVHRQMGKYSPDADELIPIRRKVHRAA